MNKNLKGSQPKLSINVSQRSNKRIVRFAEQSFYQGAPGQLTEAQSRHLKVKPISEVIDDVKQNVGRLIRPEVLRESLAQMVENKKPYRHEISRNGINGKCEIVEYHFKAEYLDEEVTPMHLPVIENVILVIVQKQLRFNPGVVDRSTKSIFINESMIPRWHCTTLELTTTFKTEDLIQKIDKLMQIFVIINIKISILKMDAKNNEHQIVIWTKVVNKQAIGIQSARGLFDSVYPKICYR